MSTHGYSSPLAERYLNREMSYAWSEEMRMRLLSALWVRNHNNYMMRAGMPGLTKDDPCISLGSEGIAALIERAKEIERETKHELVAILNALQEAMPENRSYMLHTGLTSSDVLDQCTLMQTIWSTAYLFDKLKAAAWDMVMKGRAGTYNVFLIGRTHLQPAEPTTLLHRLTLFTREIVDWLFMADAAFHRLIPYLGLMSGPVGTYGNITAAWQGLGLSTGPDIDDLRAKSQTLPRYLETITAGTLDLLAASLHKLAFDFRLEAGYGTITETAASSRVGSSAMPYKKNPIRAEKINSLCRHVHHLCGNAWDNAAWQGLERTLDDSANRRMWIPEAFLTMAEVVFETMGLLADLENSEEMDPEQWYDIWSQSRTKSWTEAQKAAGKNNPDLPSFINSLDISIQHDKQLMDAYVTMKWPGGDLQYFDLSSPMGLLKDFRWDGQ